VRGNAATLIEVRNLVKYFPVRAGILRRVSGWVQAVDDVSFTIRAGETLGLVGESGCGKTTVGRSILRLIEPTSGQVLFDGKDVTKMKPGELKHMRREMQIVFQDPYSSLDPRSQIGSILSEPLALHGVKDPEERRERVKEIMDKVGLAEDHIRRYPHEFSGGQRQRIGIARALAVEPALVVCDEPVSALDVSIQAQVINLLKDLQTRLGLSYLFIAHDLAVVKHTAHRIAVMYLGQIVELASKDALFADPRHPYTRTLLAAIPRPDPHRDRHRAVAGGDVPSPMNPPPGCRFHTRCPFVIDRCRVEMPALRPWRDGHLTACHRAEDLPPADEAAAGVVAPMAAKRLALYAQRRAAAGAAE